jgi:hypothetical protein
MSPTIVPTTTITTKPETMAADLTLEAATHCHSTIDAMLLDVLDLEHWPALSKHWEQSMSKY